MMLAQLSRFSPWVDGPIVGLYLLLTMAAGLYVRKYVRRVEDFLVAGRELNLYLGIASLAATEFGVITCMYTAQAGYTYGFAGALPGLCQAFAMLMIGATGFCVKRLRSSGAMTLPELFEQRFGPAVRCLSGVVIVLGGLLNMGVFIRVGGDFLCIVCGFDRGHIAMVMTILLILVAVYTMLGGMLSVLVTDFLQFVVMSVGLLVVTGIILYHVGWGRLVETVEQMHGGGGFNPLQHPQLGWKYLVMQLVGTAAATLTWQTTISRLLAAKDAATGQKIYTHTSFFFVCRWVIPGLWGMAALAITGWHPLNALTPQELQAIPAEVQTAIAGSPAGQPLANLSPGAATALGAGVTAKLNDVSLHAMPEMLGSLLPMGLMGLLIAAMLAADMSTDSSYMLGWGSVIYNDIMAPFRRRPWSDRRAIRWNRAIVALIGVYLFVFGLLYQIEGGVWSYILLTASIYLSSMSVLLIACCYWSRANSWGAYGAIVLGAVVPVAHLTMEKIPQFAALAAAIGADGAGLLAFAAAALGMIGGSLLKPRAAEVSP